jgi:hypothetical protein
MAKPTPVLPCSSNRAITSRMRPGSGRSLGGLSQTAAGKSAHARVRKVSQPHVTDLRTWGAHEKARVKPASAEEGKR